jgi:CheY-like chemotaxis protein
VGELLGGVAPRAAAVVEPSISVLLVEDNPTDYALLQRALSGAPRRPAELTHAGTLAEAIARLGETRFDLVLLDLGLPDSQGVETFAQLHAHAPNLPVLVLTSSEDEEEIGRAAVAQGAQDYLSKAEVQPPWLVRSIRYALERARLQRELREARQRDRRDREIAGVERLSRDPGTSITAGIYSAGALRETVSPGFDAAVAEYTKVLQLALDHRTHKETNGCSGALRELGDQLGFLRAGPRDVIEIHTTALRPLVAAAPTVRANAYVEESRLTVLELMGNLVGYYRTFYHAPRRKEATS